MSTTTAPASGTDALQADTWWSKFNVHRVPPGHIVLTAFGSYLIVGLSWLAGAPVWVAFPLSILPWLPIAFVEVEWTYKHYGWFVIFFVMALVQTIHYSEHVIEVIQVHIFNTPVPKALALFSQLNVEGVHFFGDSFLTLGTLALIYRFPRNPWLWVALPFQIAHQAEHTFLFWQHVVNGYPPGGPGLLATSVRGDGAIAGLLNRPDLHFIYNTLYTIPFVGAFIYQLKQTYDESLEEAFPTASRSDLLKASKHMETFNYAPGETVVAPGDLAHRLYVITEGEAAVLDNDNGREVEISVLGHGKIFGEHGLLVPGAVHDKTIRAKTRLSVLVMDEDTFKHMMVASHDTPPPPDPATPPLLTWPAH
ncbi:MAG: cyclic nucleotide-binding domain-containing protein [Actinomycetota bacterium]|nr:cyclic nucleotide-binding domain-containing protein [Actinomycetota bacterium]